MSAKHHAVVVKMAHIIGSDVLRSFETFGIAHRFIEYDLVPEAHAAQDGTVYLQNDACAQLVDDRVLDTRTGTRPDAGTLVGGAAGVGDFDIFFATSWSMAVPYDIFQGPEGIEEYLRRITGRRVTQPQH